MTLQQKMQSKLQELNIPSKEIKCYGGQIMITVLGRDSAEKWHSVLSQFCRKVRMCESIEYNKVNENTVLLPSRHKVWLVNGSI